MNQELNNLKRFWIIICHIFQHFKVFPGTAPRSNLEIPLLPRGRGQLWGTLSLIYVTNFSRPQNMFYVRSLQSQIQCSATAACLQHKLCWVGFGLQLLASLHSAYPLLIQACVPCNHHHPHHHHSFRARVSPYLPHLPALEPTSAAFISGKASSLFLLLWKLAAPVWGHGRSFQWWQKQQKRLWQSVSCMPSVSNSSASPLGHWSHIKVIHSDSSLTRPRHLVLEQLCVLRNI